MFGFLDLTSGISGGSTSCIFLVRLFILRFLAFARRSGSWVGLLLFLLTILLLLVFSLLLVQDDLFLSFIEIN